MRCECRIGEIVWMFVCRYVFVRCYFVCAKFLVGYRMMLIILTVQRAKR